MNKLEELKHLKELHESFKNFESIECKEKDVEVIELAIKRVEGEIRRMRRINAGMVMDGMKSINQVRDEMGLLRIDETELNKKIDSYRQTEKETVEKIEKEIEEIFKVI
ncbi:hypothetical protein QJR26_08840 [Clostridium baratii]